MKKIVRDNIPNIVSEKSLNLEFKILSDDKEYFYLLVEKLNEETNEYIKSLETEELCDIVEVIYAILKAQNVSIEDFEEIRKNKKIKNGGFDKHIVLLSEE